MGGFPQGRVGDRGAGICAHGCVACPHPVVGPGRQGSPDVLVNNKPALRVDDPGVHSSCCQGGTWTAQTGSATVLINNKGAHRQIDFIKHCGGIGILIEGSNDVIVG